MNRSPWLDQLLRERPLYTLDQHRREDVVVIGGGIAGLMTAAWTLLETSRSVLLIEATRLAHGATGHNAGQVVSYFERSLASIVQEFGLDLARDAVMSVESAWDLLQTLRERLSLTTPLHTCIGFAGIEHEQTALAFFTTNLLRERMGLHPHPMYLVEGHTLWKHPSIKHATWLTPLSAPALATLLETPNNRCIAAHAEKKGVTNSAALTEELACALLARYPDRFSILEETPVHEIRLGCPARLLVRKHTIEATSLVLCTNGFESFRLVSETGVDINTRFHEHLSGTIGYMKGYVVPQAAPVAMSYLSAAPTEESAPYGYMTRRPHGQETSLVCWGGAEEPLAETVRYRRDAPYPETQARALNAYIRTYRPKDSKRSTLFAWHGLMGYTHNRLRIIGQDPCHPCLYYNLGCNGVGILPSIYGGKRLAHLLNGETLPRSIFDPHDTRCELPSTPATSTKQAHQTARGRRQKKRTNTAE
ncbi:FAD-binding oxidoreductase [Patescibacteria group bacterium]|nr:FAD-binding oxidoreductase [Patescibacteria group bacterium]